MTFSFSQLALPLSWKPLFEDGLFSLSESNKEAFYWISQWPTWPHPCLSIYGPHGAGKTHLGVIWGKQNGIWLSANTFPHDIFPNTQYLIDGIEKIEHSAFLTFYQELFEKKSYCLFLGKSHPTQWSCSFSDIKSRILSIPSVAIHLPDDLLLQKILNKCFAERGIILAPAINAFLVKRMPRSFEALQKIVECAHKLMLKTHRPLTFPLANEILTKF